MAAFTLRSSTVTAQQAVAVKPRGRRRRDLPFFWNVGNPTNSRLRRRRTGWLLRGQYRKQPTSDM